MVFNKKIFAGQIRIHVGIASIFVMIVIALTAVIVWNNYREASSTAVRSAEHLFDEINSKIDERLNGMLGAVKASVDAASAMGSLAARPRYDGLSNAALETMIRMVETLPHVFSVFVGFDSGGMLQVSAPRGDPDVLAAFGAPEDTQFIIRTIARDRTGKRYQYLRYLNRSRHVIAARSETEPDYDPRKRGWYTTALAAELALFSDPFVFFTLQKPGITASRRLIGGGGVVGAAVTLTNFSQFLSQQIISANGVVFTFNSKGEILAHQDPSLAKPLVQAADADQPRQAILRKADQIGDRLVKAVVANGLSATADNSDVQRLQLEGQTFLVQVGRVGVSLGLDHYVAIAAPLSDFTGHISRMQQRTVVASIAALVIALPLIYLIARRIAKKLTVLAFEADKIRRFELDDAAVEDSLFLEVHNLSQAFGSMKQAMHEFGRYVPKALVQDIVQSGTRPELGGHRQEITVLFTDVADFTRIAEATGPEDLMLRTSEYFEALGTVLSKHHGVVDKYIGDAIMAMWNAPTRDDHHVVNACTAVLQCREVSRALCDSWEKQDVPAFHTRLGLHCGEAVVGNVGGADRINFTAVGATINMASRLEALNKLYGTEILVSEDVADRVGKQFLMRQIDRVLPVGIQTPVNIYELLAARPGMAPPPTADDSQFDLCTLWDDAYAAYTARDWEGAVAAFGTILRRYPDDGPSRVFADRCRNFMETPPAPDWDGVTRLNTK